jgi:hypothetical protein
MDAEAGMGRILDAFPEVLPEILLIMLYVRPVVGPEHECR